MIKTCPICNRPIRFNMTYSNGEPLIYYVCLCGYNTLNLNQVYKVAANTIMGENMVSDHT